MNSANLILALQCLVVLTAAAQDGSPPSDEKRGLNGLQEVEISALSDPSLSPLGTLAVSIQPTLWKHAESANFIYHFFHGFVATPVSVEAEYYYRVVAKELGKDTTQWERKSHIYIFERPEDWTGFQSKASLDPWTGGIHMGGDLFIQRNPEFKFKGRTLGHEITHLVIHRFFGSGVPLWLNEGYAEYASIRAYAAYNRARGYSAKPTSETISPGDFIPLDKLTNLPGYPGDVREVMTFYQESEKLVRFLCGESEEKFIVFLEAMSQGNRLETVLGKSYGSRFAGLSSLEDEFKPYAAQNSVSK